MFKLVLVHSEALQLNAVADGLRDGPAQLVSVRPERLQLDAVADERIPTAQRSCRCMLPLGIALLHKPEVNQVLQLKHGPPCLPHLPNPQTLL